MKRVSSLANAERVWLSGEPWRNEHASWRQLAERREKHKRLVKLSDERGYQCVLYSTAVVTYFTDGGVELRCYDTQSTKDFADCVAPKGCSPVSHHGRMFWKVRTDEGICYYREGKDALLLKPTPKGNWSLATLPSEEHEWVHDRKLGAEVRKRLRPYTLWYQTTLRLGALPVRSPSHVNFSTVQELIDAADNPERFFDFATTLGGPERFLSTAYKLTGARYQARVPHDRLPRRSYEP